MKICLINNLYKPFQRGGADRITQLISEGLQSKENNIFIITTKPYKKIKKNKKNTEKIYYINSWYYYLGKIPLIFRAFWHIADIFDIRSYLKIKKIINQEKPDIIITGNLKGVGFLTPGLIKKLQIKHIHILHDIQLIHPSGLMNFNEEKKIESFPAKLYSKLSAYLFNSPSIVISPSKWLMDMHKNKKFFINSKKIILPNPILPKKNTKNKTLESHLQKHKTNFLYVGELEEHKGILLLINAFNSLAIETKKPINLTIIGTGSKMAKAKEIASKNNNIKILGWQSNEDVKNIMINSDCLIMPSLCYENSPTVIYEAACSQIPIISSRIGGATELIHKLGGILFTPDNKTELKQKMKWLINNPEKINQMMTKNKKNINNFYLDKYIDNLARFLKN